MPVKTHTVRRTLTIPARGRIGSRYLLAAVGAGAHTRRLAVPLPVLAQKSTLVITDTTGQ